MIFAGGQINCTSNIDQNILNIKELIDYGSSVKADLCVTPEYALTGFVDDIKDWNCPDKAIDELVAYASSKNVGLLLGTMYEADEPDKLFNQVRVYDKSGDLLKVANKLRVWGSLEVSNFTEEGISDNIVDMPNGDRIGILICNDMWGNGWEEGPNISRRMFNMGARINIHCTNAERGVEPWKDNILREYHNSWIRQSSIHTPTLSVDNACMMDGTPYRGPTSSQSGVAIGGNWVVTALERGVDFFHFDIGRPYNMKKPWTMQNHQGDI